LQALLFISILCSVQECATAIRSILILMQFILPFLFDCILYILMICIL